MKLRLEDLAKNQTLRNIMLSAEATAIGLASGNIGGYLKHDNLMSRYDDVAFGIGGIVVCFVAMSLYDSVKKRKNCV